MSTEATSAGPAQGWPRTIVIQQPPSSRWLTWVLRRDGPPADAGAQVRDFYTRFYHRTPSDEQIAALLRGSGIGR